MNAEDKLKAVGEISPEYIEEARAVRRGSLRRAIAAGAAAAAAVGLFFAARGAYRAWKAPGEIAAEAATPSPAAAATEQVLNTEAATASPFRTPDPFTVTDAPFDWNYGEEGGKEQSERAARLASRASVSAYLPNVPKSYDSSANHSYVRSLRMALQEESGLAEFYKRSAAEFLKTEEPGKNALYSPLNVYMALAMMAETASGSTRAQILELLGADSIEALRTQADLLWLNNYADNDVALSVPASSLWLNSPYTAGVNGKVLERLSQLYHTSVFEGDMDDPEYSALFRDWMNEQTHDLLSDQIDGQAFTPDDLMALAATLYFRARWDSEFPKDASEKGLFHSPSGDEEAEFMHGYANHYYVRDGYKAVCKNLKDGSRVWFILPDEGVGLDEVLEEGDFFELKLTGFEEGYVPGAIIHFTMPKLDAETKTDLKAGLKRLGVTDCFDPELADFSELTGIDGVCVTSAQHGVRVKMDEEGVEAAAYVELFYAGAAEPTEEVWFTLDRPFLFVVESGAGTPLFAGTVYSPAE